MNPYQRALDQAHKWETTVTWEGERVTDMNADRLREVIKQLIMENYEDKAREYERQISLFIRNDAGTRRK